MLEGLRVLTLPVNPYTLISRRHYRMELTNSTQTLSVNDARILWRAKNRGIISTISQQFGLSRTMIRRVLEGEIVSAGRRVERELATRGCPGFEEYLTNTPEEAEPVAQ